MQQSKFWSLTWLFKVVGLVVYSLFFAIMLSMLFSLYKFIKSSKTKFIIKYEIGNCKQFNFDTWKIKLNLGIECCSLKWIFFLKLTIAQNSF